MIESNHFNYSQERLHCDYVTNILKKEMILGIPDQVILYNFLSMLPQSYRHYPTYLIRAVVILSFLERFCFISSCTISSIQSLMELMYYKETKRKIIFLFIYILILHLFTVYTSGIHHHIFIKYYLQFLYLSFDHMTTFST